MFISLGEAPLSFPHQTLGPALPLGRQRRQLLNTMVARPRWRSEMPRLRQ